MQGTDYNSAQDMEERSGSIRSIYTAFGKRPNEETISYVVKRTGGMAMTSLIDVCRRVSGLQDMPHNLAREMLSMAGGGSGEGRECCPECCVYVDGKPEEVGGERNMYVPGFQRHKDTGLIPITVPCNCRAGQAAARAMAQMRTN